ncbi:MAG: amidohydrolase family protein, partial [Acidimicrobiia bacterium]
DGFGWVGLDPRVESRWWDDTAAIYGVQPPPLPGFTTPAAFRDALAAASPTRIVLMAPHGNIRGAVMGDEVGRPTRHQMAEMHQVLEAWLDAGAVGMASGLDYLPGRNAGTDEVVELCERVTRHGGVYASHLRLHDLGREGAWEEIGEIGRRSGVPIRIAHERLDDDAVGFIDRTAEDNDLRFDTYLYPAGCTSLAFHVPAQYLREGIVAFARRLATDSRLAAELASFLETRIAGRPGQRVLVAATTSGAHEGRWLDDLAAEWGLTVGRATVRLMIEELPAALVVYVWQAEDTGWDATVRRTVAEERSIVATDGIYVGTHPHPRGFGAFPRVLGTLVRDQKLLDLPHAIHKMTGAPAAAYGLNDRGIIAEGLLADIVVFDPFDVAGPGDYEHPRRQPIGIRRVLVGGREPTSESEKE